MKSTRVRYKPEGGLELIEVDVPGPGPGQVQVRGIAGGICAWDLHTYAHGAASTYAAPPGHEGVGYVTKVGSGVTGVKEGDRVVGRDFARLYNMSAHQLHIIPDSDIPDEQWIVEPVACVVTGLDHCRVRAGDRVAVIGCGFMGLLIVQGLGHSFAEQVIGIDINPRRLELARQFGASEVIRADAHDIEQRAEQLRAREIDTVVDCSGAQQGLDLAAKIVKRGGRICLFGWNHGRTYFTGDDWHLGGFTVVNASPSARLRDTFPPAIRLLLSGTLDLRPLITHVVDLEDFGALMERVTSGLQPDYIKGVVRL